MDGRRVIILFTLLLAAPTALAQDPDPTVNDSDFNTTPPAEDETYLDDAEAESTEDPTVSDSDFDTTAPTMDESYLDEDLPGDEGASAKGTPGAAALVALVGLAATAIVLRRRA